MDAKISDDDPLVSAIQDLSLVFHRLKLSYSLAEVLMLCKTVALGVFGATNDPPQPPASKKPSSPPSSSQPPLSKSARKRARQSPAARERADAKRAAYLRAKADGLAKNAAHVDGAKTPPGNIVPPPPPSPPPSLPASLRHEGASDQLNPSQLNATISGLGKRGSADRSPLKPPASPSTAQTESKRAYSSTPKQLAYDSSILDIGASHSADNMDISKAAPDGLRAAIEASIAANRAWKGLSGPGYEHVYERVIYALSQELLNVDDKQWSKLTHERLGKVAGYICKLHNVWIE